MKQEHLHIYIYSVYASYSATGLGPVSRQSKLEDTMEKFKHKVYWKFAMDLRGFVWIYNSALLWLPGEHPIYEKYTVLC